MTLGWGLMIQLDYNSSKYIPRPAFLLLCLAVISSAKMEVYPMVTALGIGCLFQIPLIALQAAMPIKDMATSASAFMFLR